MKLGYSIYPKHCILSKVFGLIVLGNSVESDQTTHFAASIVLDTSPGCQLTCLNEKELISEYLIKYGRCGLS